MFNHEEQDMARIETRHQKTGSDCVAEFAR